MMSLRNTVTKDNGNTTTAYNRAVVAGLSQAEKSFEQSYSEWRSELQKFIVARVKANLELRKSFAACRSPVDFFKANQEWLAVAARDYYEKSLCFEQIATMAVQEGFKLWPTSLRPLEE